MINIFEIIMTCVKFIINFLKHFTYMELLGMMLLVILGIPLCLQILGAILQFIINFIAYVLRKYIK